MSVVVCFDIRNFSTHVAHLSSTKKGKTKDIVNIIKKVFQLLDDAIIYSNSRLELKGKTFVNHTGDGFVSIFHGRGKCIQGLLVATKIATEVKQLLNKYNNRSRISEKTLALPPLDYGIGINIGPVTLFDYKLLYSQEKKAIGVGLLGHVINLASRIQETTKDHTFHIICTKRVHDEAIDLIKKKYRERVKARFSNLGRHKLRGMRSPIRLYGVNIGLYKKFNPSMITRDD